jgi:uncharacterized protein YjbI with pentapeptide repeats
MCAAKFGDREHQRSAYIVPLAIVSLFGLLVFSSGARAEALPSQADSASAFPGAVSTIAFHVVPRSVAPGGALVWAIAAVCTTPSSGPELCDAGGSGVNRPVPNGYAVNVVIQPGNTCDFSTETLKASSTLHLGLSVGAFPAPTTPGTYCFEVQHPTQRGLGTGREQAVVWSAATSNSETVTVGASAPSVATTLSNNSIAIGDSVTDTAILSGGASPTGTITFTMHSLPDCSDAGTVVGTVTVSGNGAYSSPSFTPSSLGTFYWQATYSGDTGNAGATGGCGIPAEILTVNLASPSVTTSLSDSGSITIGASANDTATLVGAYSPTGTVTFTAYSDAACSTLAFTSTNPVSGSSVTSGSYRPPVPGTYYWRAAYSGDANNNGFVTSCGSNGEPSEILTVDYLACSQVPNTGGANLKSADLEFCNLAGYNLSGDNLEGANLQYADLQDANLGGANLKGANLAGADAHGADFKGANLKAAGLAGANISGDNFLGANLQGAGLSGVDAIGANFQGANLKDSDMSYGNFSYADFTGANTKGANTTGANFTGAINPPP